MKATDTQVSGNHYKKYKIQPVEFIVENNIPFLEANVIKYVLRHKDKNGIDDLLKAKHYIDIIIQYNYNESKTKQPNSEIVPRPEGVTLH